MPSGYASRRILVTALAIGLLALLGGLAGFAVFTDSASVPGNTFTTGSVDISTNPPPGAVISFSGVAPGDQVTNPLIVSNLGTLQLRYAITGSATNPDGLGLKDQLVLTIRAVDATTPLNPCDNFDGAQLYTGDLDDGVGGLLVGNPAQGTQGGERVLGVGASETLCFRAALPISTGPAFQGATTTATFVFEAEQTVNNP
jgi:predicted ribosomally synthesized peptide with SipW-like signal peptide